MRFRKKPVVIEAEQLRWDNWSAVCDLIGKPGGLAAGAPQGKTVGDQIGLLIPTLEGLMEAKANDWIIKGVNGEIYPCKPDIFEKTYEPA